MKTKKANSNNTKAGAGARVQELGRRPGLQSGKYSLHFDRVVAIDDAGDEYTVSVPMFRRADCSRVLEPMPIKLPHEVLSDHFREHEASLRSALATSDLPRAYHEHPVTVRNVAVARSFSWPLALYYDGVKFSRTDSDLGCWLVCLLTGRRWLLAHLRKSEMCHCGCLSWCSLFPMHWALSWSLTAAAKGEYPASRHDGACLDAARQAFVGFRLPFNAVFLFVKADWMEFCTTLAFPAWSSSTHPCPVCWATRETMYSVRGLSALGCPCKPKTFDEYCAACSACEIEVALDERLWRRIRASLIYDTRKNNGRGRVLGCDIPEAGLSKGDRLEPSPFTPDIGASFNADETRPLRAVFWRRSKETLARHRNPLFTMASYITPERCLVFDFLHGMALGVFKRFMAWLVWELIRANAWQFEGLGGIEMRLEHSVPHIRRNLFHWYDLEHAAGREHTRVQDLKGSMFGTNANIALNLHGAETVGFLAFGAYVLQHYGTYLGDNQALATEAWTSLDMVRRLTKEHPVSFPNHALQPFVDATKTSILAMQRLGIDDTPKVHAFIHLAASTWRQGSPAFYACWQDESLNQHLKAVAASCHRQGWALRVLRTVNTVLERSERRRQR